MTSSTITLDTLAGLMDVTMVGDPKKPVILTLPDIGLNRPLIFTQKQNHFLFFLFFAYKANKIAKDKTCFSKIGPAEDTIFNAFRFVHVDYPGSALGAVDLLVPRITPHNLVLALEQVRTELDLSSFVGLGVGFGAHCLTSYALAHVCIFCFFSNFCLSVLF